MFHFLEGDPLSEGGEISLAEFAQGFGFHLTDALTGDPEQLTDFL